LLAAATLAPLTALLCRLGRERSDDDGARRDRE
jgi:hypothetical protein